MESKDLLNLEDGENQNSEVNSGASQEAQSDAALTETTPTDIPVEETKPEEAPAAEATTEVLPEEAPAAEATTEALPEEAPAAEATTEALPEEAPAAEATTEALPEEAPAAEAQPIDMPVEETQPEEKPVAKETKPTVSELMEEIETAPVATDDSEDDEDEKDEDESIEKIEAEYANLDCAQAIAELQKVVLEPNFNIIKHRVGILKAKLLEEIKKERKAQLDTFLKEGGEKDDFQSVPCEWEKDFNASLQQYKDNKAKFIESLEAEKQKNLEAKNVIIEGLKNLIESESNLKVLNDKFKEFQEQWKEIGPVPQNESTNLWQNYHFYVEKFFDILRINKELRTLDLKKNLEQKIKLCETAESLLLQESINKTFKELQQLHDEWKEIGPVPEDKKEEVWERFKNASDQINQRRRDYYDKQYAEQQNNYNAKVVLCEQAEELAAKDATNAKESSEVSEKLTELLKVWKTLGPAPAKLNDEIWFRFKSNLDKFFQAKKEHYQTIKDEQTQNYNLKLNLAIQAEAIAKRTDWRQATEEILNLQKEWKNIGATSRKHAEQIWKRFRGACDQFFEAKSNYFSNIQEIEADNLNKKEEVIKKILSYEFSCDKTANLDAIKAFQREWMEIGFVPKKEKDRIYADYRDAVNKRFADLKMSADDVRRDSFKNKIDNILNNPNADRLLDKEKRFLVNKVSQLKDDINLWENNLGFFANSKNADILKEEFAKKIDIAKNEVKELEYKIKMMNAPKKKEEPKQNSEETEKKDEL